MAHAKAQSSQRFEAQWFFLAFLAPLRETISIFKLPLILPC